MYRVTYRKEGDKPISPIREYQVEYCLPCELQGKCDFDQMLLCATIRSMNYAKELYGLKKKQMEMIEDNEDPNEESIGYTRTALDDFGF